jgi:hypothetical protein
MKVSLISRMRGMHLGKAASFRPEFLYRAVIRIVYPENGGALPVILNPLAEAQASILVLRIMPIYVVRCHAHYV